MERKYVLEVCNPRGVRETEIQGLTAPRIPSIEGKKIAIIGALPESIPFNRALEKALQEKYPTAKVVYRQTGMDAEKNIEYLRDFDAFIEGVRLSGGWPTEPPVTYEKAGIPGIHLSIETMYPNAAFSMWAHGLPTLRIVPIPALMWVNAENKPDKYGPIAEYMVEPIVRALTEPLTEEEKNPPPCDFDFGNLFIEGKDYDEAYRKCQDYFLKHAMSDGLPIVPPTPAAVEEMLTGTSRDRNEVIPGIMQPGHGVVTIEKIAINAVMAGARPEHLPVIITTVELLCDPGFMAWHVLAAINSSQLLIYVGGPIAKELGMNGHSAFFGPGNPANNAIGRAVGLCALNLGWIEYKTHGGMVGQPSRFCNLIFCENEDLSPWETYSVSRGFSPEDSTVMIEEVFHVDGTWQLGNVAMPSGLWTRGFDNDLKTITERAVGERPSIMTAIKGPESIHATANFVGGNDLLALLNGRTYVLILHPGQAHQLRDAGYTRESLARYIADYKAVPWEAFDEETQKGFIKIAESGKFPGLTLENCKPGGKIPAMNSNRLAIFVAGQMSGQTLGMMCLGSYGKFTKVEGWDPCDPPFNMKKITGATLTKAGR
jgi:hypothetical protein